MKNERTIIGGLLVFQLVLWLGFLFHHSPRFPGSLTGGILGVLGAVLMIFPPLLYSIVKRIERVRQFVTKRVSLSTLLTWHVYTGIVGSILAILHIGHHFQNNLGIWLTTMMLLTVFSGFVGRYYLAYASMELREKKDLLNSLATEYNQLMAKVARQQTAEIAYVASHNVVGRALNSFVGTEPAIVDPSAPLMLRAERLTESIADVEYAIAMHDVLKRRTTYWLVAHIATSSVFYVLLVFHIWSAIYFGLRWFN